MTTTCAKRQLKMLVRIGASRAVAAIEHSILQGWQGIFEPKVNGVARGNRPPPLSQVRAGLDRDEYVQRMKAIAERNQEAP